MVGKKKERKKKKVGVEEEQKDGLTFQPRKRKQGDGVEEEGTAASERRVCGVDDAEENAVRFGSRGKMTKKGDAAGYFVYLAVRFRGAGPYRPLAKI